MSLPVVNPSYGGRRPQWRGERQAVLVRLSCSLAHQLRNEAARQGLSVSETAAMMIGQSLAASEARE